MLGSILCSLICLSSLRMIPYVMSFSLFSSSYHPYQQQYSSSFHPTTKPRLHNHYHHHNRQQPQQMFRNPRSLTRLPPLVFYAAISSHQDHHSAENGTATTTRTNQEGNEIGPNGQVATATATFATTVAATEADETPFSTDRKNGNFDVNENDISNSRSRQEISVTHHYDQHDCSSWPWSEQQTWMLQDQVPRYTVQVPVTTTTTTTTTFKEQSLQVYCLWRTLSQEVTEFSGYPLPVLMERYRRVQQQQQQTTEPGSSWKSRSATLFTVLPYLDEFAFSSSGGLSGRVYGVPGVADGSVIETTPVENIAVTVPRGFVQTQDGTILYELGRPAAAADGGGYSLGYGGSSGFHTRQELLQEAASRWKQQYQPSLMSATQQLQRSLAANNNDNVVVVDPELTQLGALTAMVIGGALAFETLSHHLTVNVFWV